MFGYDWPRFHAAVNDLPAALLFVTVLFDIGAWLSKRESLKAAALWTLWAGVIGGGGGGRPWGQSQEPIAPGETSPELIGEHDTPGRPPPRCSAFRVPPSAFVFSSPPARPSPPDPTSNPTRARW